MHGGLESEVGVCGGGLVIGKNKSDSTLDLFILL